VAIQREIFDQVLNSIRIRPGAIREVGAKKD
jgi:hypothetical protein